MQCDITLALVPVNNDAGNRVYLDALMKLAFLPLETKPVSASVVMPYFGRATSTP